MNQQNMNPGELPEGFTVVKFSTPWCGPCKMLTPKFDALEIDGVNLISVNPEVNDEWMMLLNMRSVPTTVGFKNGEEIFRVGGDNIQQIKDNIQSNLI
jgi:thioredoxin 1